MKKSSAAIAIAAVALLNMPIFALAQSTGGAASGSTGSPAGSSGTVGLGSARGTNSAGTAQSSGGSMNSGAGVTTGSANPPDVRANDPIQSGDAALAEENKTIDRKIGGICRGC